MHTRKARQNQPFLICLALLLCSWLPLAAQEKQLTFERLGTEHGLSSNVIYHLFQDSKGYLWILTNEGLNRYDGYSFKVFKHQPQDTTSLPSNLVGDICEDAEGYIWIATNSGLCRYNYEKNAFQKINLADNDSTKTSFRITPVNKSQLLIVGARAVWLINIRTLKARKIKTDFPPSSLRFISPGPSLLNDKKGNIYLSGYLKNHPENSLHIFKYDSTAEIFKKFTEIIQQDRSSTVLSCFFTDSRNNYWAGSDRLYRFDNVSKATVLSASFPARKININTNGLFEDHNGNIWISTDKGVLLFDNSTGRYTAYQGNLADGQNMNVTRTIIQDKTGIIWIASFSGLYKTNPGKKALHQFTSSSHSRGPLLNNFILGIEPDSGNRLLIHYYWGENHYSVLEPFTRKIQHRPLNELTGAENLKRIIRNNSGNFYNEGAFQQSLPVLQSQLRGLRAPLFLYMDNLQKIWLVNETYVSVIHAGSVKHLLRSDITDVKAGANHIWIATVSEGLFQISTETETITSHASNPLRNSISSNNLICLLMEKNGNLWIGTRGNGLDYYDIEKKSFRNYSTADGLCNNSVFSMVQDEKQRLWIGTGNGLSCFDPGPSTFTNFSRADGLANTEFNRYSACKLSNGYILMGGMNGIDYFLPDQIINTTAKPQVQITGFKIFNKDISPASNIQLPHDKNYVSIEFAAMDFRDPSLNRYAYQLKGIDNDWVYAGNQHAVSYASLSPGSYHFMVKAAGSDGVWSEGPAEIYFIISAPWWKTGWFYSGLAILLTAVLYSMYRFRINQLKKVFAVRTKISQDLHDEVGATLTSISFLSEVATKQSDSSDRPVNETISRIGEYSRNMISEMNDIVWAINPANDRFSRILDRMQNFASTLMAAKNISFEFYSDPELQSVSLGMEQRKNLYLIFKEALNNAAKYADCSEVTVKIFRKDQFLYLSIKDNGVGFSITASNGNGSGGNGIPNMQQRALDVQAILHIDSKPGRGTHISLAIPITQNAY